MEFTNVITPDTVLAQLRFIAQIRQKIQDSPDKVAIKETIDDLYALVAKHQEHRAEREANNIKLLKSAGLTSAEACTLVQSDCSKDLQVLMKLVSMFTGVK